MSYDPEVWWLLTHFSLEHFGQFFNQLFIGTNHEYFEVLDIALLHIFECFAPWKLIIFNLSLCFEINYLHSSLKGFLILPLAPKNILTVQNRKSDVFQKMMMSSQNQGHTIKPGTTEHGTTEHGTAAEQRNTSEQRWNNSRPRDTHRTPTEHPETTEAYKAKNNYIVFKEMQFLI